MTEQKSETVARKLLLVEDHPATGEAMRRLLSRAGFQVTLAGSVAEACAAGAAGSFDLVITDLRLSDGTGEEVLRALCSRSNLHGIVLSGLLEDRDKERLAAVGVARFFTKPADWSQLLRAVRELASQGRASHTQSEFTIQNEGLGPR